jgi:hypothetical protein
MRSLTKTIEIVENAGDSDPGMKNGAILKSHLEFFELVLVLFDLAINIRHETIFEGPFPW